MVRQPVHQLVLVEVVLWVVRQEQRGLVGGGRARAVLIRGERTEIRPRLVEFLRALGDAVEEGVDLLLLLGRLLLGRVVVLGRRTCLAVEGVDLLLDLLQARLGVGRGGGGGRLGEQGHGGEGGRGESGGAYARARSGRTRLAVRRHGSASPSVFRLPS